MSLRFENLSLSHFRNLSDRKLSFSDGITILQGHNATGKTNTIEALQFLTAGRSFRKPTTFELLEESFDQALIQGTLKGDGRFIEVGLSLKENKKAFQINGKKTQASDMPTYLPSVLFCPDDLTFIKGAAAQRRSDLDLFASQVSAGYAKILNAYTHSIEQRNRLLKETYIDNALLDVWDESVAYGAATLLKHRLSLFERLKTYIIDIYQELAPQETLTCSYVPSCGIDITQDRETLKEAIFCALQNTREEDRRMRHTTIGPHRDDLTFEVNKKDARAFCSQGQQRSLVLSWKLAQVKACETITDKKPLLLLDDVMSELDEQRRQAILSLVEDGIQTVITTTNLGYFSDEVLQKAHVIRYGEDC